ncbi:MAG: hypothetical protein ABSB79_02765 [Syntrophales bacterium]
MGKNPAFQFYPSDWTRDLDDQDLELEGAWIRICCRLFWAHGKATKSLKEWSNILRTHPNKTGVILKTLLTKNICSGEFLDNQNITIISRRMVRDYEISQIRSEVGKLGGNPGLNKIKKNRQILLNQTNNQNDQSSSSSSISSTTYKDNKKEIGKKEVATLPGFISEDIWIAFIEMRNKLKAPLTDHAKQLIFKKLGNFKKDGSNPDDILNQSIENGWKGLFPLKNNGGGYGRQGITGSPGRSGEKTSRARSDEQPYPVDLECNE